MGSTLVNKTISSSKRNFNSEPKSCLPKLINAEIDRNCKSETNVSTSQNRPLDSTTLLFPLCEENFLLETINKIIKKRWRIIGHTTRYGWLAAAGSYKPALSPEDAKILLALSNQIGVENCTEAIERIKNLSENLHPRDVPAAAIAILTETHTAMILSVASHLGTGNTESRCLSGVHRQNIKSIIGIENEEDFTHKYTHELLQTAKTVKILRQASTGPIPDDFYYFRCVYNTAG